VCPDPSTRPYPRVAKSLHHFHLECLVRAKAAVLIHGDPRQHRLANLEKGTAGRLPPPLAVSPLRRRGGRLPARCRDPNPPGRAGDQHRRDSASGTVVGVSRRVQAPPERTARRSRGIRARSSSTARRRCHSSWYQGHSQFGQARPPWVSRTSRSVRASKAPPQARQRGAGIPPPQRARGYTRAYVHTRACMRAREAGPHGLLSLPRRSPGPLPRCRPGQPPAGQTRPPRPPPARGLPGLPGTAPPAPPCCHRRCHRPRSPDPPAISRPDRLGSPDF
jgi:hypothetical protein